MQPANVGYHPYQFPYYPPPVPQDHELKKQYLALLPPQQIIEICLTFDIHVPPYVKSTIWPLDINAAIAGLRKSAPNNEPSTASSEPLPAMGSLSNGTDTAAPSDEPAKKPDDPQPPDKSTSPQPGSQMNMQPSIPQPPYPHQPYGFPQPQSGYPHTSYYGHAPAGFSSYTSPYPYQQPPTQHSHLQPASQPNPPPFPPLGHHPHPSQPQDSFRDQPSTDDLPSYEEMIVEALNECGDSEGCAPKELFTWMASRYPLQSNFRPSASQALQKAFKRGRFEKNKSGKYRLNATWEGGNTSRRTTRRPQTHQTQTLIGASSAPQTSPFTHAPLVHQSKPAPMLATSAQPQSQLHHQSTPFGLPYPPVQNYPSSSELQPVQSDADTPANAYEAAQHILQAINFGGLFKMPAEDKPTVNNAPEASPATLPHSAVASGATADPPDVDCRAELQAHLALLAAQLAEIAHADKDDEGAPVTNPPPRVTSVTTQEEEDSDVDMEEVI